MIITRAAFIREFQILAAFSAASMLQTFFVCKSCTSIRSYTLVATFTLCLWIFLWRGNSILADYLSRRISWINYPVKRFVAGLASTVVYTLAAVFLILVSFETLLDFDFGDSQNFTIFFSVTVTLMISLFLHCREFLISWRLASLDSVRLQRESISAKYESLKSQVNPSFLFHSLNTLSTLLHEDEDKENAVAYIKQLADVYRYVLDTRDKELVPLRDEFAFLGTYQRIIKARLGISIDIVNSVTPTSDKYLPPSVFHMVVENVIDGKQRDFSPTGTITINYDGNYVTISLSNHLLANPTVPVDEFLISLQRRFSFLTDKPVLATSDLKHFRLAIPVIVLKPERSV